MNTTQSIKSTLSRDFVLNFPKDACIAENVLRYYGVGGEFDYSDGSPMQNHEAIKAIRTCRAILAVQGVDFDALGSTEWRAMVAAAVNAERDWA